MASIIVFVHQHRRWLASALLVAAVFYFIRNLQSQLVEPPWDYGINGAAARHLWQKSALYFWLPEETSNAPVNIVFGNYIGPPTTALLYLPFVAFSADETLISQDASFCVFSVITFLCFAAAIYITGLALPAEQRVFGWFIGAMALLTIEPVRIMIQKGQVDGFVALALALGLWGASRQRWWMAGSGFGLAALLKISPAIILVFLALQRKWQALVAAMVTTLVGFTLTILIGRPADWLVFVRQVLPSLAEGAIKSENQSLPAWFARLFTAETRYLYFHDVGLGHFRWLAPLLAMVFLLIAWQLGKRSQFCLPAMGLLIAAALLAGPVAWTHYSSWSILVIVLLSDGRLWRDWGRLQVIELATFFILAWLLLAIPQVHYMPESIAANGWLRLVTGTKTMANLLLFSSGVVLLNRAP